MRQTIQPRQVQPRRLLYYYCCTLQVIAFLKLCLIAQYLYSRARVSRGSFVKLRHTMLAFIGILWIFSLTMQNSSKASKNFFRSLLLAKMAFKLMHVGTKQPEFPLIKIEHIRFIELLSYVITSFLGAKFLIPCKLA